MLVFGYHQVNESIDLIFVNWSQVYSTIMLQRTSSLLQRPDAPSVSLIHSQRSLVMSQMEAQKEGDEEEDEEEEVVIATHDASTAVKTEDETTTQKPGLVIL